MSSSKYTNRSTGKPKFSSFNVSYSKPVQQRSSGHGRPGMTVLGRGRKPGASAVINKIAAPKPINLPSLRSENKGNDPNTVLVNRAATAQSAVPTGAGQGTWQPQQQQQQQQQPTAEHQPHAYSQQQQQQYYQQTAQGGYNQAGYGQHPDGQGQNYPQGDYRQGQDSSQQQQQQQQQQQLQSAVITTCRYIDVDPIPHREDYVTYIHSLGLHFFLL
eukprot:TRINITY_DN530_c0_g3_i2.p1 TRINITY_DN530_c0_g3~~TRINITY_DN530_c0_g3_i2.p1  ORF type:complete len:216 (-),score=31.78 TRINITY_DN530_c0_g3_i2:89-736(-)